MPAAVLLGGFGLLLSAGKTAGQYGPLGSATADTSRRETVALQPGAALALADISAVWPYNTGKTASSSLVALASGVCCIGAIGALGKQVLYPTLLPPP